MDVYDKFPTLLRAEPARLIPLLSESNKEQKATSILLAVLSIVPDFMRTILKEVGGTGAKKITTQCLTEVTFKLKNGNESARPDGLLYVSFGKKNWSALVEVKVGNADLEKEQIETYLDIAREVEADAVITISNQFALLPTHSPTKVSKQKLRSVGLFHFSWLSLVTKALLLKEGSSLEDSEKTYILGEMVRYFNHKSTGTTGSKRMCIEWKDAYTDVQQEAKLRNTSEVIIETVSSWHEMSRYLTLHLGSEVNCNVQLAIKRKHFSSPETMLKEHILDFIDKKKLTAEFLIPDASAPLLLVANFSLRTITLSMLLDAPKDFKRATACFNWLTRQLQDAEDKDLIIEANWPGWIKSNQKQLESIIDDPRCLVVNSDNTILPISLEITKVIDLGARFKGSKTFFEDTERAVSDFYKNVGQHLRSWQPSPPKMKTIKDEEPSLSNQKDMTN